MHGGRKFVVRVSERVPLRGDRYAGKDRLRAREFLRLIDDPQTNRWRRDRWQGVDLGQRLSNGSFAGEVRSNYDRHHLFIVAFALENGREKTMLLQFEDKEPAATLQAIGFAH